MSIRVMELVYNLDLPTNPKFVLVTLAKFASDDGSRVFPSVATVARLCGLSTRTVQRCHKQLVKLGVLVVGSHAKGGRHPRIYAIDLERTNELINGRANASENKEATATDPIDEVGISGANEQEEQGDSRAAIDHQRDDTDDPRDDTGGLHGCQSSSPDSSRIVNYKERAARDSDDTGDGSFDDMSWKASQATIRRQIGDQAYNEWLNLLRFKACKEGVVFLQAPTLLIRDYARANFREALQQALGQVVQIIHATHEIDKFIKEKQREEAAKLTSDKIPAGESRTSLANRIGK